MALFRRKNTQEKIIVSPPPSSRVEVELHKNASEEAATKAKEANEHLNDLLVENGFTLKIFLAAGGSRPARKTKVDK